MRFHPKYFLYRMKRRVMLFYLYFKQKGKCKVCGIKMELPSLWEFFVEINSGHKFPNKATFEHIKRKTDGGKLELSNLVLLCWRCNYTKGNIDAGFISSPFSKIYEYKIR